MFTAHLQIPAALLPADYIRFLNSMLFEQDAYGPNDLVEDVPLRIDYNPGNHFHGSYMEPPDTEDPEILSVFIDEPDYRGFAEVTQPLTGDESILHKLIQECWGDQEDREYDARCGDMDDYD